MTDTEQTSIEERIIHAAIHQFTENGYDKTSMSNIAAMTGINRPTLHYYFRTKERLFQCVFGTIISELLPQIHSIMCSDKDFFDRIEQVIDIYFKILCENPDIPRFVINEIHRDNSHLIKCLKEIAFENNMFEVPKIILSEMRRGAIRKVPLPMIFLTFYGLMSFPFLTKGLIDNIFFDTRQAQDEFLESYKKSVLMQMRALLAN